MYKAPRGTADILPQAQPYWRYVEGIAADICQLCGYQRIDTPVFEDARLFIRSIGDETDIVKKEMYTFEDRSGTNMTLRPEGTAAVCRAYLEHGMHSLPQPVKLYYIAPIFRYERPQAGRYRQHYQFGFEAIGDIDPALDAEIIHMAWQFYTNLGLRGFYLKLNSIGCPRCRPKYLEELRRHYTQYREQLCRDCQIRLVKNPLRLLDCKQDSCQPAANSAPHSIEYLCSECSDHFNRLQGYLDLLGIPFEVTHRLVRGFDYYNKTVFEIQPEEEGAQSALGGGGRYDGLIEELGGRPTPAIGFAAGIERVILNLKRQEVTIPTLPRPDVFIAYVGQEAKERALRLVAQLREKGIGATIPFGDKSLRSQLRQANTSGVSQTLIIGEEEVRTDTVLLRDMVRGEQRREPLERVLSLLKGGMSLPR